MFLPDYNFANANVIKHVMVLDSMTVQQQNVNPLRAFHGLTLLVRMW